MKIEKKKVVGNKPLSIAVKRSIAATLGMAAAFTLSACDDSVSAGGDESVEPLGGDMPPDEVIPPASSDSPEAESSSSQVIVDIPQSHETFSSSVLDALSSAAQSSSSTADSSTIEKPTSSSSTAQPSIEELCKGTPGGTTVEYNSLLYVCPDHGNGMISSMVTTFERDDVTG